MTLSSVGAWSMGLGMTLVMATGLVAQEPDWSAIPYTSHSAYQAVDASGGGIFATDHAIRMRGILINRAVTLLDTRAAAEPFLGGQWQVFVQAVDSGDHGGTALWMGQYYGHLPFIGDPADVYTNAQWEAELARLDHDPATGRLCRPGDLVEVRASAPGLFHNGKTNINEQHTVAPEANFELVLLQADYMTPTPRTLRLAEIKDGSDQFIFDPTRLSGAEYYQGTLVAIPDVRFTAGTWGPDQRMTLTDGSGRTLTLQLGRGSGFSMYGPPAVPFTAVGILDQDDSGTAGLFTSGYTLWAMDYDGSRFVLYRHVRPDFDRDGDVDGDDLTHFQACVSGPAIPPTSDDCRGADFDGDGDVDQNDFGVLQRCSSGAESLADPRCDQ